MLKVNDFGVENPHLFRHFFGKISSEHDIIQFSKPAYFCRNSIEKRKSTTNMFHFNAFHAVKCVCYCCIDSYTKGESFCYSSFRICAFLVNLWVSFCFPITVWGNGAKIKPSEICLKSPLQSIRRRPSPFICNSTCNTSLVGGNVLETTHPKLEHILLLVDGFRVLKEGLLKPFQQEYGQI